MSRSLTAGIAGQLTAQGAYPGYLIELTFTTGEVQRYTTLDVGFTYGGYTWNAADVQVSKLEWDGGIARPAALQFGDASLAMWSLVLNLVLPDAKVRIWQIYAAASGEAEPVWSGRVGQISRSGLAVDIELNNGSAYVTAPRQRVQYVVNPAFLLPGGTILQVGNQRWTLDRPVTAQG